MKKIPNPILNITDKIYLQLYKYLMQFEQKQ